MARPPVVSKEASRVPRSLESRSREAADVAPFLYVMVTTMDRSWPFSPVMSRIMISRVKSLSVITFTSFNPGEGKTSSVEGLAWAAVRGGLDVLVIDADTRTASLTTKMGARGMPGLTNVIVGTVPLDHAVLEVASQLTPRS